MSANAIRRAARGTGAAAPNSRAARALSSVAGSFALSSAALTASDEAASTRVR